MVNVLAFYSLFLFLFVFLFTTFAATIYKSIMRSLLFLFVALNSILLYGKNMVGRIVNEKGIPICYANVVFLNQQDNKFISGVVSNKEGAFSIPDAISNIKSTVLIQVSCIGYVSYKASLSEIKDNLIVLVKDPKMLKEVVVKADKQLFKMEQGVLVADVKNSLLSQLGTANDVLDKIPFITKSGSSFTVFGKGTPQIYINNRLVRDPSELTRLSSKDIKEVSLITSPGAEYDATVNSIIKIVTLRPQGEGYSGTVYTSLEKWKYFEGLFSGSINYRVKAFDFFTSLGYYRGYRVSHSNKQLEFNYENEDVFQKSNMMQKVKINSIYPELGFNFNPNPNSSMGLSYNGIFAYTKIPSDTYLATQQSGTSDTQEQFSFNKNNNHQHILNGYYSFQNGDKFKLDITADAVLGGQDLAQNTSFKDNTSDSININSNAPFNLFASKINSEYKLGIGTFGLGAEYTRTYYKQTYEIDKTDLGLADSSDKTIQNRLAFFLTYNLKFKYFNMNAGARYESINGDYYSDGVLQKDQSPKDKHIFPSVSLSYDTDSWQVALSYHSKISYPNYTQLRNFALYISPFVYELGNPNLKPELIHSTNLSFVKKNFRLMCSYDIDKQSIYPIMTVMADRPVIMKVYENLESARFLNAVASYSLPIGFWEPTVELGVNKQWLYMADSSYNHPRWSYKFLNTLRLPNDYSLRVDLNGSLKGNSYLAYYTKASYILNLRATKSIKNFIFNLSANDILQTSKERWRISYNDISWNEEKYYNSRNIGFSISYRFNATNRRYKGETDNDELNRL